MPKGVKKETVAAEAVAAEVVVSESVAAEEAYGAPAASPDPGVIDRLMARLAELEAKLASQPQPQVIQVVQAQPEKPKETVDLGPPPPARKARPHILVLKDPFTSVRVEVPEDYSGPGAEHIKQTAEGYVFDAAPLKGYQNHENTLARR